MKTEEKDFKVEELNKICKYLTLEDSINYNKYIKEGNIEAAKEVILDRAGEINAIFACFLQFLEKKL